MISWSQSLLLFSRSVMSPCDTMDCSMPGFPVLHHLPELAETHVHWVGDGHPTISSFVIPFSSCLQSFPALGSFPMILPVPSSSQSIGASASESILPMNIQDWFPLGFTGLISLHSEELPRVFNTIIQKHQFLGIQPSWWSNSHIHTWLLEKTIALSRRTFVSKLMSLLFNMLSRMIIAFLPRSRGFDFMAAVTICSDLGAQENKVCHGSHCFPIDLP